MRKTLTLASLIAAALVLAGPAARAITYPRALAACAGRVIVAIHHIKALHHDPALDSTPARRALAAKANDLILQASHTAILVYHKLTHDPAFRHSPAATHIVCQIAGAFRADERILAFAAAPAHAPAPAPRRAARGVQGQLGLHPRALGGGGAMQITHTLNISADFSHSIQHTHSETHTRSISHNYDTSRSISHEHSETRSRTLSHTLSRGRTHSRASTTSRTLLCPPQGCPRNDTQAYEWGMCFQPTSSSCPNINWRAVAAWRARWRRYRASHPALYTDASGSPYARLDDKVIAAEAALWPAPAGTSSGGVVKIEGDKRQMKLRLPDGSVWSVTRLPGPLDQVATLQIVRPRRTE